MRRISFILIFAAFLLVANLFLFRPGIWLFQDAMVWQSDFGRLLQEQLLTFVRGGYSYYLGYDQGIFAFNSVLLTGISFILVSTFGASIGQVILILLGYTLVFYTSQKFFRLYFSSQHSFYLALLYTFNPFGLTLEGGAVFLAMPVCFLYTGYHLIHTKEKFYYYLLLNILSAFFLISYVRLLQAFLFVILPFTIWYLWNARGMLSVRKVSIITVFYGVAFAPIIFSYIYQFLIDKSSTALNYTAGFSGAGMIKMHNAFNFFQSFNLKMYTQSFWMIIGILFSAIFVLFLATYDRTKHATLFVISWCIFLLGISFFALGSIVAQSFSQKIVTFLPFIVNGNYWAFYVSILPFCLLLGISTLGKIRYLQIFVILFLIFSVIPMMNLNDPQFRKFDVEKAPESYQTYFYSPFSGIAESSFYIPDICWRAEYMRKENITTACINFGEQYSPVSYLNSRLLYGDSYFVSKYITNNPDINNLRITHNLKNIFVPKDIVVKDLPGGGPQTGKNDIQKIAQLDAHIMKNPLLKAHSNPQFTQYFFSDKNTYDFFIYTPRNFVLSPKLESITDNLLEIAQRPVVVREDIQQHIGVDHHVEYKTDPLNPDIYFVKITGVQNSKQIPLQFNQTFNKNWVVVSLSKREYEKQLCKDPVSFAVTNNTRCAFSVSVFDPAHLLFLIRPNLVSSHHTGNYLSNLFFLDPNEKNGDTMYAAIIFKKQIIFQLMVYLTIIALTVLVIFVIYEKTKHNRKK